MMGLREYIKKYKDYETKELSRRVSNYKSKVDDKKDWQNKLKKEMEAARRESYRKEALRRATISGRVQASKPMGYSYFAGLTAAKPVATEVKKVRRKKRKVRRRSK